ELDAVAAAEPVCNLARRRPGLIGDFPRERGIGVDLELVEARADRLPDDGDLLLAARERAAHHVRLAIRQDAWSDANDVRILRGKAQQLGTSAPDEERRVRALDRTRKVVEALDPVETALEVDRAAGEEALHDGHRFRQAVDPGYAGIVGNARRLVLRNVASRAHANLEAPVAQAIERR